MFTAFVRRVDRVARSFFFYQSQFLDEVESFSLERGTASQKKSGVLPYRNVVLAIRKRTA